MYENDENTYFKAVFLKDEFIEMFDPRKEYGKEFTFRNVESRPVPSPNGAIVLQAGDTVGNVYGTSNDPKHNCGATWKAIMISLNYVWPATCPICGMSTNPGSGSHMTRVNTDTVYTTNPPDNPAGAVKVACGSDDVFIVPTCAGCNHKQYALTIQTQVTAMKLTNFMQGVRAS
ncbi:MAG: hypothetical protein LBG43_07300 [Treponema sp.]|jgi:hypothetical protein|nr:hypothetical protein [Treponema sp.]